MNSKKLFKFIKIYSYEVLSNKGSIFSELIASLFFPILIQLLTWTYIYSKNDDILLYSREKMILYIIITVFLVNLNNGHDIIYETSNRIKSGLIDTYSIKPIDYNNFQFFSFIGKNFIVIVISLIIISSINIIFGNLLFLFPVIIFVLVSQYICFQLSYIFGLSSFWFVNYGFLTFLYYSLTNIFGGVLLPIEFWPEPFQTILRYNPFRLTVSGIPDLILNPNIYSFLQLSALFLFYGILFNLIIKYLKNKAINKYISYGG
ncbi:ABC-2 family transporter protein [Silvanigrella aquatica]|uniref:ABC-2 family transporter protein n=1 Tax=Silvanigrella aquatica TaxID=1915309 RepID=UPI001E5A060D|nr:ABC-2 family transporter protein [Silvanigrella aquatica]